MYAKIVTLLALFVGSLTGINSASQSATGDNWTDNGRRGESEQVDVSHEPKEEVYRPEVRDDPRQDRPSEDPQSEPLLGCHTTDGTLNPEVEGFATQLGVSYEAVLSWYCTGYSFETIQIVYDMSILAGVSMDQIYDLRVVQGYTWDDVIAELGITFSRDSGPPMILDKADQNRSDQ